MILQWHSSRHGLLPFKLWVAGCLAIGYPYLSKSALGHSIGLPLNPLSMYQWWWSFCVKLASVDSPNNLLTRAYSFNSCYFRTPARSGFLRNKVETFRKRVMAFIGLEYGPIDSIFMLGTELLFRVKGRAVARTAFTGKFTSTGRGVESTIS
uniref:Uncharacterized protein n=1 Tax=Vicia faba TaxID=3906 RepID=R4IUB6_VICFA|nr:hypothetical protein [Vicia faba]